MTGWTITCDSGGVCPAFIDPDTGLAKFQANTGTTNIIYTITYTDENGNCGSTTIRQPGNCSGPGPEPPQPVGACNFTKYTTSNIPSAGGTVTAITYNTELCDANSINATSTTEGVNLSVGDGIITMEVGSTDSQRTIDVTVKVTIEGEEKTYDFTFIQSGSSPEPGGLGNVYMNFELRNNTGQDIYSIPRIKLWVYKKENGIEYYGFFYIQEKNWVDRGCSNFKIPPYDQNHPVILSWNELEFMLGKDKSRVQDVTDPDHWITLDVPASFMNNGTLLQASNNEEPYLYTYINGSNLPSNQRIKVFLVNPETGENVPLGGSLKFSAGTESEQANYILDISLKQGASGTINQCT